VPHFVEMRRTLSNSNENRVGDQIFYYANLQEKRIAVILIIKLTLDRNDL
jgi:hypothetical protein